MQIALAVQLAFCAGFVGLAVARLVRFHHTELIRDQWRIYADLLGRPLLEGLLSLQNDHRPVVPHLLYLADIYAFGARNHFLFAVGLALDAATAGLLSVCIWRDRELPGSRKALLVGFTWCFLFWLGNFVTLGWGVVGVVSCTISACLVGGGLAVTRAARAGTPGRRRAWLGAALASAVVASFTAGQGIVLWPALLVVGWVVRLPVRSLVLLAGGAALCAWLYAFGLPSAAELRGRFALDPRTVAASARLWLGSLPNHVAWLPRESGWRDVLRDDVAPVLGAAALLAAGVAVLWGLQRRGRATPLEAVLLGVVAFGAGVALLSGVARAEHAERHEHFFFAPRYLTWITLFWLGLLSLGLVYTGRARHRMRTLAPIALLIFAFPLLLWPTHVRGHESHVVNAARYHDAALGLVVGVRDPEAAARLFRNPGKVFGLVPELRRRDLAMFRDGRHRLLDRPLAEAVAAGGAARCVGEIERVARFPDGAQVSARIAGWAGLRGAEGPPDYLAIVDRQGSVRGLADFTRPSERAAAVLGAAAPRRAGFAGYIRRFGRLSDYRFVAVRDGRASSCALRVHSSS